MRATPASFHALPTSASAADSKSGPSISSAHKSPPTGDVNLSHPPSAAQSNTKPDTLHSPLPPPTLPSAPPQSSSQTGQFSLPPQAGEGPLVLIKQLQCRNGRRDFVIHDQFEKLVLKQCTSSRFKIRPPK